MDELIHLCNINAIAGHEEELQKFLINNLAGYADEIIQDGIGSLIFRKKGKGPKVLFMAHMDEVGFMVRGIDKEGKLRLIKIGGIMDDACHHQKVCITTDNGKVYGVLQLSDLKVDIGTDCIIETKQMGVQVGDMVTFSSSPFIVNNQRLFSKALDDRVGCYVLMKLLQNLKNESLNCDLYIAFTSSEEVGTRGGKTATHIIEPDISIAVDVASTKKDIPEELNTRKLGKGMLLVHYDKTLIPQHVFLKKIKKLMKKNNIPYQPDMLAGGGTDAGVSHLERGGCLALVIGIPLHECHAPYSLVDKKDIDATVSAATCISKSVNKDFIKNEKLTYKSNKKLI